MLNDHVLVRIGGGWDGLEHYLMTHVKAGMCLRLYRKNQCLYTLKTEEGNPTENLECSPRGSWFCITKHSAISCSQPGTNCIRLPFPLDLASAEREGALVAGHPRSSIPAPWPVSWRGHSPVPQLVAAQSDHLGHRQPRSFEIDGARVNTVKSQQSNMQIARME